MTTWLTIAGWTLMHFVWEACAIAVPVAVVLRIATRRSANLRYGVACLGLGAMVMAPVLTARILFTAQEHKGQSNQPVTPGFVATFSRAPAPTHGSLADVIVRSGPTASLPDLDRVAPAITLVWLAGVVVLIARMAGGWWSVRRLHRHALQADASRWQVACRRIAFRLGLPAAAHVVESSLIDVPTVVGWLRPAILLPVAALATLSPQQVEAILAHELAHIRRHDYLVNMLQTFAETLLFYHPAVWWVSKRIRVEREHCCDDVALAVCGDALSYAEALAVLEQSKSHAMRMAMAATGGALLARVRRILGTAQSPIDLPRSSSWAVTLALTLVFTAGAGGIGQLSWPRTPASDIEAAGRTTPAGLSDLVPGTEVSGAVPGTEVSGTVPGTESQVPRPREATAGDLNDLRQSQSPELPAPPQPPAAPEFLDQFEALAPPALPAPPSPASAGSATVSASVPAAPPSPKAPAAPQSAPIHQRHWRRRPPSRRHLRVHHRRLRLHRHRRLRRAASPPAPAPPSRVVSRWSWSDDDGRMEVTLHGGITFKDDLSDVESMSDGGLLRIRDWSHLIPRTIEIRSEGGRLTRSSYVAGVSRAWDAEAEQRLREALPRLVRRTGLAAESRVKYIFERKGLDGVLDVIGLLESDYARHVYFVALIDRAHPDSASVPRILAKMDRIGSDYDRSQVLQHVASRVTLDQRAAAEYVRTVEPIRSDYEKRRALSALLAVRPLPAGSAGLVLRSAVNMRSDYDRSEVLRAALAQEPITDPDALFTAVGRTTSSYEQRRVLSELADHPSLSLELKRGLLTAASSIKSDFDRASVLLAYVKRHGAEVSVRQPLFAAVNGMRSDYEKRRVLTAIAASPNASDAEIQRAVFDSVALMRSDYDRAEILLAVLRATGVGSASRPAFVAATERMGSSYDQNRVLAALVRAERR